ncbi:MAG: ABC transporter permease subunit [Solirubrobacterales bacterium]|nr:ABC transporter permease subunit [Solirubrobacterales bacterium]
MLGALASSILLFIAGMVIFVFLKGFPSFAANGFAWFGAGGNVDEQLANIFNSPADPAEYVYFLRAWPLLWSTFLISATSVAIGIFVSVFTSIFIVEFAPTAVARVLEPVVKFLAAVPSVIYGLIGILVIVPWINDTFITEEMRESVAYVIQLDGSSVIAGVVILTVMICPIMIAIIVDALRAVPEKWVEGAAALGVNRWRAMRTVSLRAIRPAIVAALVLATARALGEAIMLSMVAGSVGFAPNPLDGFTFFLEPARPLASTIVDNAEGLSVAPFGQTMYAFAAILLISSAFLSFAGWAARKSFSRYTLGGR